MKKLTLTIFLVLFFALAAIAKVNINTATVDELTALPGIGAKKAAEIVNYRKENGDFKTIEDLTKVKGIGDKSIIKLKKEITIDK